MFVKDSSLNHMQKTENISFALVYNDLTETRIPHVEIWQIHRRGSLTYVSNIEQTDRNRPTIAIPLMRDEKSLIKACVWKFAYPILLGFFTRRLFVQLPL